MAKTIACVCMLFFTMAESVVSTGVAQNAAAVIPRSQTSSTDTTTTTTRFIVHVTPTASSKDGSTSLQAQSDRTAVSGAGPLVVMTHEDDTTTTSISSSSHSSSRSTSSSSESQTTSSSRSQSSSEDEETSSTEDDSQTTTDSDGEKSTTRKPSTSTGNTNTAPGDDEDSSTSSSSSSSSSSDSSSSTTETTIRDSSSMFGTITSPTPSPTSSPTFSLHPATASSSSAVPSSSASATSTPVAEPTLGVGTITGISVGVAAVFFILVFLASWLIRYRRNKRRHAAMTPDDYVPGVWPRPYDPNRNTSMENTNTVNYTRPSTLARPLSQIGAGRFYAPASNPASVPLPRTPTAPSKPQADPMDQVYEVPSRPNTAPLPTDGMEMRSNPMRSNTSLGRGPNGVQEPLENEYRGIQMTISTVPDSLRPGHRRQITPPWKTATELYAEQHGGRQWQAPAW